MHEHRAAASKNDVTPLKLECSGDPKKSHCGLFGRGHLHSIPEQNAYQAAEEGAMKPASPEAYAIRDCCMAKDSQAKSCALPIAVALILLAMLSSILALSVKTYLLTRLLPMDRAVVYSTDNNWSLLWADEFEGSALDASSWTPLEGDGSAYGIPGWGNEELQVYTGDNVAVAGGVLSIRVQRSASGFTSARLTTAAKRGFVPGRGEILRIEGRIQLPPGGDGIWPAFWMLPAAVPNGSLPYGVWPRSGEIDIMESVNTFEQIFGSIHYGLPQQQAGGRLSQSTATGAFSGAYHVYAVDWSLDRISWSVDGMQYGAVSNRCKSSEGWRTSGSPGSCTAPFDQSFGILLNVAIGGSLPGKSPSASTDFPQVMLVDYVRVYTNAWQGSAASSNSTSG